MTSPDYILNLTRDKNGVVHLHADRGGLSELITRLEKIKNKLEEGICEHDHLFTEEWGGDELSSKNGIIAEGHDVVHHLKIFGWTSEWTEKHGFR
jgi:hypothetical protein